MRTPSSIPILGALLAGCTGEVIESRAVDSARRGSTPGLPTGADLLVRSGAPERQAPPETDALTLPGAAERLGTSADGAMVVAAGGKIYELVLGKLELRLPYAEGADTGNLGTVQAIAARRGGGAWIATSNGLFLLGGHYVTRASLNSAVQLGSVRGVAEADAGPLAGLWLATSEGLFRHRGDSVERYSIAGFGIAASAIAVTTDGAAALTIVDGQVLLLTPDADGVSIVSERPPLSMSGATVIGASKNSLYAGGDSGLVRWMATATPPWTHFTLTPDPQAPPRAASALVVDTVGDSVWMQTATELVRLQGDRLAAFAQPGAAKSLLGVDPSGDIWTTRQMDLVRLKSGVRLDITFDRNLRPWLVARCTSCHADFVDPDVFDARANTALGKVRAGDMPRCEGGIVCPPKEKLAPADFAVLEGWIRAGKPR
jgi:hypothetical protein